MPTFDARLFARGWLSVAIASTKDLNPVLDRTVLVELHDEGARLTSTDRRILLTTWVPTLEAWDAGEPDLDTAPAFGDYVVTDLDGRGSNLLGYALALTNVDTYDVGDVELDLVADKPRPPTTETTAASGRLDLPDERRYVVLELPDVEKVWLRQLEDDYPSWRRLVTSHRPKTTKAVALDAGILGKLAKLGKYHAAELPLLWHFGGADKVARLEVAESEPSVTGLVMPSRWTFDEQETITPAGVPPLEEPTGDDPGPPADPDLAADELTDAGLRLVAPPEGDA